MNNQMNKPTQKEKFIFKMQLCMAAFMFVTVFVMYALKNKTLSIDYLIAIQTIAAIFMFFILYKTNKTLKDMRKKFNADVENKDKS